MAPIRASGRMGGAAGLVLAALAFLGTACHGGKLELLTGTLVFSSPDHPDELMQPDAGVVQIDFGQVLVGASKSLTLQYAAEGSAVTLQDMTAIQADTEFNLPFLTGMLVGNAPNEI